MIGGPRFFERPEIRDAMAYSASLMSPDDDLAFERIVNMPKRGIGDTTVQELQLRWRARTACRSSRPRAQLVQTDELAARTRNALGRTPAPTSTAGARRSATASDHASSPRAMLEESGYTAAVAADKRPTRAGRLENLKELVQAHGRLRDPAGLSGARLPGDGHRPQDDGGAKVQIMTLHAAKGLEFPLVFLPGWEEGVFPSQRSMDENGEKGLEEERRLAYVGITRAREELPDLLRRQPPGLWPLDSQLPSRFVDELPRGERRGADPDRLLRRRLRRGGAGAARGRCADERGRGRRLQLARAGGGCRRRAGARGDLASRRRRATW